MRAGADEAGRGPVLGPLVVAGIRAPPDAVPEGVDDSKALSARRRGRLAETLWAHPDVGVATRVVPAPELNERMDAGESLDEIEIDAFATVLTDLEARDALVDAVGADTDAFEQSLADRVPALDTVQARTSADAEDPLVGAASIVAKVLRDRRIDEIAERVGHEIGSGYPSDPTTRAFLEDWRTAHERPPAFARHAWSTLDDLGFGTRRIDAYAPGGSP